MDEKEGGTSTLPLAYNLHLYHTSDNDHQLQPVILSSACHFPHSVPKNRHEITSAINITGGFLLPLLPSSRRSSTTVHNLCFQYTITPIPYLKIEMKSHQL